jgi:endonuclease/exonuclease/phosphatase family metal-dependent hydrolase
MPYYHPIKKLKSSVERRRLVNNLLKLRTQLSREIPDKTSSATLLLATWNIRKFGENRRIESLYYLAEIISRFDLVAIQEVSPVLRGLDHLLYLLGDNWDYIVTDSTEGSAGGSERMAFVYDKRKVTFKKIAGEIVLPKDELIAGDLQFARTPFCVSFQSGWFKFTLASVHIYFGSATGIDARRLAEIESIGKIIARRAQREDRDYILLGDFNIVKYEDKTFQALERSGFTVPEGIRLESSDLNGTGHYDQIAFKLRPQTEMLLYEEGKQRSGIFDFSQSVYRAEEMEIYRRYFPQNVVEGKTKAERERYYLSSWRTFQLSDHLPLWVELQIDFSDHYLNRLRQ